MTGMRSLFVLAMLSAHAAAAAENEAPRVTPELRQRAEDLAGAASKRFTEVLGGEQRVAQNAPPNRTTQQTQDEGAFSRVWEWLARSAQTYDDVVIAQLKNKDGWTVIVQRSGDAAPAQSPIPAATPEEPRPELHGWSGLVEIVRDWLARANRSYRNEVVKPLLEPAEPGAPSELVEQPPAATPAPIAPQRAPGANSDADAAKKTAAEEEIKREAEAAGAKRVADEAEAKRKAGEDKRIADEAAAKREADEAKRIADEAAAKRKAAEAKRIADEAAAKRKADEAKRIADEAAAKRKADEAKRIADEAADKRKADEAKRIADEAEAKHKAVQAKREAEAADATDRNAVAEAEADAKRQADIDAEATRRSEAASRAKQAARAEFASPAPATPQAGTEPAVGPQAGVPPTPTAKPPHAAEASPSPDAAAKENSAVAVAPPEPERKPMSPAPTHQATPKAREGSVVADVAPSAVSKKRTAYKTRTGKKHASAYRHKRSYAHKGHRKPRYAVAHGRKHRAYVAGVVYVQRRCDCRCGRAFYKPRKRRHAAWHGYGSPRRSGLTYRRSRHYIR